jgi:hypothetical protein
MVLLADDVTFRKPPAIDSPSEATLGFFALLRGLKMNYRELFRAIAFLPIALVLASMSPALAAQRQTSPHIRIAFIKAYGVGGTRNAKTPSARDTLNYTVQFNQKTFLMGWTEYNIDTCTPISSGNWNYDSMPMHGTPTTAIENGNLTNGDCPGVQFPFNEIFYTWDKDESTATTDTFNATWSTPDGEFSDPETFDFKLGGDTVTITSASMTSNSIQVKLTGGKKDQGTLDIALNGDNGSYVIHAQNGSSVGPGKYDNKLTRPNIPLDNYTSVTVTWNVSSAPSDAMTLHFPWEVGSNYHHSVYNTPLETNCRAGSMEAWEFDDQCIFQKVHLRPDFVTQVLSTGTGLTGSQLVKAVQNLSKYCSKIPDGATKLNSLLKITSVTGNCNTVLDDNSVATYDNDKFHTVKVNLHFKCGNHALLVKSDDTNQAVKLKEDECPGCAMKLKGTNGHIDDYSASRACHPGDPGDFWTANVHGESK